MQIEDMKKKREELIKRVADNEQLQARLSHEHGELIGAIKMLDEILAGEEKLEP